MKKKLMIISEGKLIKNGSASDTVMCGLVDEALKFNYDVSYICLFNQNITKFDGDLMVFKKNNFNLKIVNIKFKLIKVNILKKICSNFDKSCSTKFLTKFENIIFKKYDSVIAFDSRAIEFAKNISSKTITVILGDPAGKKVWHSNSWSSPMLKLKAFILNFIEPIYWNKKIPKSWNISMFGSGHCEEWQTSMNRKLIDLRPFMPHYVMNNIKKKLKNNKIDFVFGGSMTGTASRMNFIEIFTYYFPILKKTFGDNFNLILIGFIPEYIKEEFKLSNYKEIKMLGRVDDFEKEISKFDIFFLPSKYPVGVRTRICSALAAECLCIVDKNILFNMPELVSCSAIKFLNRRSDFQNVLNELKLKNNLELYRKQAKDFFKSNYLAKVTSKKILH